MSVRCTHLDMVKTDHPCSTGCEACPRMGDARVRLRPCPISGHVGCCDHWKSTHATRQHHGTRHPIITSLEPGADGSWCSVDPLATELA